MNSYGTKFRLSIFGESHGPLIGVVLDGVPAGMPLSREDFLADLDRRRSGAKGSTPRKESDLPEIVSGVCDGHTTGAPLTIVFRNSNTRSGDYSDFRATPRPGHADFVAERKYRAFNDLRGGGHFSGRLTLTLVAAGVVAKKMIGPIEKAIQKSDIGINPSNDGKVIRLIFPDLTEERRRELAKQIKALSEDAKVAARNIRRDAMDKFKAMKKAGELTEDDQKKLEEETQKLTDKYVKLIDDTCADKNKEIMEV